MNQPRLPGANTGHGHVFKRRDGALARCGGPAFCKECAGDQAILERDAKVMTDFVMDTRLGGQ